MSSEKPRTIYVAQRVGKRFRWLEAGVAVDREDGAVNVWLDRMPTGGFSGHIHIPAGSSRPTVKDIPTESPFESDVLDD